MSRFKVFCVVCTVLLSVGCGLSVPISSRQYRYVRPNVQTYATTGTVTIKKGDTVYALSRRYNVPIRSLIETNRLRAPFLLSPGQKIKLPMTSMHIVQKGDTVYSISRKYDVDMSLLARQNNLRSPFGLSIGQKLNLPGSIVAPKQPIKVAQVSQKTKEIKPKQPQKTAPIKKNAVRLPDPPRRSQGRFAWPLKGPLLTTFGSAGAGRHNDGINIKAALGSPVKASENGVVAYAGNELKGFGNLLLVKHADGWITAYAHNEKFLVKRGQTVKRGEQIAKAGKTGNAKEPQLHFEVRKGTKAVDPLAYLE